MNNAQKVLVGLFMTTLPFAYACKSSEVVLSNRITLGVYQSGRLQNDITVRVDSLTDSRCPDGFYCIWAGNVVVRATLSKSTDQQQVRLVLGPDLMNAMSQKSDSTGVVLSGTTYSVILRGVVPYPKANQSSPTPPQAVIEVTAR